MAEVADTVTALRALGSRESSHLYHQRKILNAAADEIERLRMVAAAARDCINDNRELGGDVSFVMGGHRRIRLADAISKATGTP